MEIYCVGFYENVKINDNDTIRTNHCHLSVKANSYKEAEEKAFKLIEEDEDYKDLKNYVHNYTYTLNEYINHMN